MKIVLNIFSETFALALIIMSSLTGKPDLTTDTVITNDGFWNNVSVGELMTTYRIPAEYDNDTIYQGLVDAVIRINEKLNDVKAKIITLGFISVTAYTAVNSEKINDKEIIDFQYNKAVYYFAKAKLLQQFKTQNRREVANNEAKESFETYQYCLDQAQESIAFLKRKFLGDNYSENYGLYVAMT